PKNMNKAAKMVGDRVSDGGEFWADRHVVRFRIDDRYTRHNYLMVNKYQSYKLSDWGNNFNDSNLRFVIGLFF
ncbi:MAG: hypothetical protein JWO53_533, partial [Chlamydiia bacterium]|nr:hypothetical protein [Chlamydiia bacterium]